MTQAKKPYIIIVSGPNGAGKTTFRNNIMVQTPELSGAVFLNYDDEIANLKQIPEYSMQYKMIEQEMQALITQVNIDTAARFKRQMDQIGGNIITRIHQPDNNKYWYDQYRALISTPDNIDEIKDKVFSTYDLMKKIGGNDVHERINAKVSGYNWYPKYQQLVNNPKIKKTIIKNKYHQKLGALDNQIYRAAATNMRQHINQAFGQQKNIIFETTCSGKRMKQLAEHHNYKVYILHMCVLCPELSAARVQQRVNNGGHNIPQSIIFERYRDKMKTMGDILLTENYAIVIDNSSKKTFMPIFAIHNKHVVNISQCPEYLTSIHQKVTEALPKKTMSALFGNAEEMDVKKMNEEERCAFLKIILTNVLTNTK